MDEIFVVKMMVEKYLKDKMMFAAFEGLEKAHDKVPQIHPRSWQCH